MRLALNEARKALQLQEVPIGAVVVADGAVVGRGHNLVETLSDPTAHAEMQALTAAASTLGGKYLQGCTLYVTVEPCIMCAGLMHQARIARCVYGAADPKAGALGSLYEIHRDTRLNHTFAVEAGVLEDECASILKAFFAAKRAQNKQKKKEICS